MLYFHDQPWLIARGHSRFEALIQSDHRTREDVFWQLRMEYVAGGAAWRRVHSWERPHVHLCINGFDPELKSWTGFEHLNFWDIEGGEGDEEWRMMRKRGWLEVRHRPGPQPCQREKSDLNDHIWRVAGRSGGWFTVEMAAFADGQEEERPEPDAEFWKQHAQLYLIEDIPFGTVDVCVPHNVRDPEAFAERRDGRY